jgi:hypothetical protein
VSPGAAPVDSCRVNDGEAVERRRERAVFETDRHLVVGDVTLPPEGYQSRFSDAINRGDVSFIPLTDVEITSLNDGEVVRREFIVLGKAHVKIAFPIDVGG